MNDFVKDTTEIPSLSFGAPEPEPELPVQQPEEKKEEADCKTIRCHGFILSIRKKSGNRFSTGTLWRLGWRRKR